MKYAVALTLTLLLCSMTLAGDTEEAFWDAARAGDLATVKRLVEEGVDVNAKTTYDATANRERQAFVLIDLYVISLFRYRREGNERHWSFLRFFNFSSGVGELEE